MKSRKKYKVTTNSNHKQPVFDNVLGRNFKAGQPNQAYVGDITYLWTQEGWLYLAVVIDLFSRKVVGWSMSSRMKAQLVTDALQMAIWQRRPEAGLIVHSDRGSQYASNAYRRLLNKHDCVGSMSRKGNCWDNAVAESFFGSLEAGTGSMEALSNSLRGATRCVAIHCDVLQSAAATFIPRLSKPESI